MTTSSTINSGRDTATALYQERIDTLRAGMATDALAVVIVTSPETIFYLTGFSSTAYYMPRALIIGNDVVAAVTCDVEDGPLHTNPIVDQHHSWSLKEDAHSVFLAAVTTAVPPGHACGIQAGSTFSTILTPEVHAALAEHCGRVVRDVHVDHQRGVKSSIELADSRRAGSLAAAGLRRGLDVLRSGITELETSTEMLNVLLEQGGDVPSSYPYTYFGPRSWRRMELPSRRALYEDEPFYLECGATVARYGASCLRTGFCGTAPTELRRIHAAAVHAFEAMLHELVPGVRAGHIDDVATSALEQHGLAEARINKVGYSIGVGFPPGWGESTVMDLHPDNSRTVEENMVFHLVSLLMSDEFGAVGVSETVEVTKGGARSLTELPRELIEKPL